MLYLNHKKITFFNYTDFVVNYDEDQYIPNFLIQLIYNESRFFNNVQITYVLKKN